LIKYIKSVLWRVAKCLSYIEEARCLKVKKTIVVSPDFLSLDGVHHVLELQRLQKKQKGTLMTMNQ